MDCLHTKRQHFPHTNREHCQWTAHTPRESTAKVPVDCPHTKREAQTVSASSYINTMAALNSLSFQFRSKCHRAEKSDTGATNWCSLMCKLLTVSGYSS